MAQLFFILRAFLGHAQSVPTDAKMPPASRRRRRVRTKHVLERQRPGTVEARQGPARVAGPGPGAARVAGPRGTGRGVRFHPRPCRCS